VKRSASGRGGSPGKVSAGVESANPGMRRTTRLRYRRRRRLLWLESLLLALVLVTLSSLLFVFLVIHREREAESNPQPLPPIQVAVDREIAEEVLPLLRDYGETHPQDSVQVVEEGASIVVTRNPLLIFMPHRVELLHVPPLKLQAAGREIVLGPEKSIWLCSEREDPRLDALASWLAEGLARLYPEITFNAVGDIIPGRKVAMRMAEKGFLYPFEAVAPYIRDADLVYADLECPLSDRYAPPYKGTDFIAPSRTVEGLKACGIDVVSLANNHSTNFGPAAFTDTLKLLVEKGIAYVGGGRDAQEAYSPLSLEIKGTRITFLSYNAIAGSINATSQRPGVAWFDMWPYAADDPEDLAAMQEAVRKAKREGGFVVVGFHWSEEYKRLPNPSMRKVAHAACDAGADMVIGTHPHCIQSLEWYGGSFIAYSLGNFVFDQMFADYTRQGIILRCRLMGSELVEIELLPYLIHDYCRPVVLDGASARNIVGSLLSISDL